MKKYQWFVGVALVAPMMAAQPAFAKPGDPVEVNENLTIDPIIAGRLRYETVDQDNPVADADALTLRLRAGAEVKLHNLSFLGEAEGTLAIIDDYNDTIANNGGFIGAEPFSVVADPDNVEINRLRLKYSGKGGSIAIGRQRIVIDDSRFVGNVGWRQNEQTFDAIRAQTTIGPLSLDGTYAISQRTIFGADAGPRTEFEGEFFFGGAGIKAGPVKLKAFTYVLDYDNLLANSTQTFGARATAAFPVGPKAKISLAGSYARQKDYATNPTDYSADYIAAEIGGSYSGFGLKAGYELLGSDGGVAAFRTPMATLHKFNGWADVFLATPATGLEDIYVGASYKSKGFGGIKGLKAAIVYHEFDSDVGGISYGSEIDASLGFKFRNYGFLVKYADYDADALGVDTKKLWIQVQFAY